MSNRTSVTEGSGTPTKTRINILSYNAMNRQESYYLSNERKKKYIQQKEMHLKINDIKTFGLLDFNK